MLVETAPELGLYAHVDVPNCQVLLFDAKGICRDDAFEIEDGQLYKLGVTEILPEIAAVLDGTTTATTGDIILPASFAKGLTTHARIDTITDELFIEAKAPKLGGISGTRGWSSISAFQRCRYMWKLTYNGGKGRTLGGDAEKRGLAVGSLIHTFLAVHYSHQIDATYPLQLQAMREQYYARGCNPEHVTEAWNVVAAYIDNYEYESATFQPLAVEYLLVDPENGQSCRYDLIVRVTEATAFLREGTYLVDHKSSMRDEGDSWQNDGELIGQIDLWKRMKLDKRFGELRGVSINNLIKTKIPQFKRYVLAPQNWQIKDHRRTLMVFSAEIDHAKATGVFPRSRAACIGRYGKCSYYDHCANAEDDLLQGEP